ncbi:MAG: hypothetical protein M3Z32_07525, partial [Acidobacteriota bacterium]|nr:hypothetical protein [Acidobacteriota bacterium]
VGPWQATVYQDTNYQGNFWHFTSSNPDFNNIYIGSSGTTTLNDQASSIRVSRTDNNNGEGDNSGGSGAGTTNSGVCADQTHYTGHCECVTWIVNLFNLTRYCDYSYPTAASLAQGGPSGSYMQRNGFYQVSNAESGVVAILQPWKSGAGSAGHIGYIGSDYWWQGTTQIMWMASANWGEQDQALDQQSYLGCTDVSWSYLRIRQSDRDGVSFWKHP